MGESEQPGRRRRRGYHHGNLREVLLEAAGMLIYLRGIGVLPEDTGRRTP